LSVREIQSRRTSECYRGATSTSRY
jgi:hypothetical protein